MAKWMAPANVNVRIAALEPQRVESFNPLQPGDGTPWEDRGALGFVKAYFQTAWMSMRRPGRLFGLMRRTQATKDSLWFALICGAFLAAGWIEHSWLWLWRASYNPKTVPNYDYYAWGRCCSLLLQCWSSGRCCG
jgi:hypothetical protein